MTTYSLLCEGACNPNIQVIAAELQRYMNDKHLQRPTADPNYVFRRQRSLRHTPHTVAGTLATCTVCGAMRDYGARRMGIPAA